VARGRGAVGVRPSAARMGSLGVGEASARPQGTHRAGARRLPGLGGSVWLAPEFPPFLVFVTATGLGRAVMRSLLVEPGGPRGE